MDRVNVEERSQIGGYNLANLLFYKIRLIRVKCEIDCKIKFTRYIRPLVYLFILSLGLYSAPSNRPYDPCHGNMVQSTCRVGEACGREAQILMEVARRGKRARTPSRNRPFEGFHR